MLLTFICNFIKTFNTGYMVQTYVAQGLQFICFLPNILLHISILHIFDYFSLFLFFPILYIYILNFIVIFLLATLTPKQQPKIVIQNEKIENVSSYEYLGALINNRGDCLKEIKRRLTIALQKRNAIKIIWHNTNTQINLRLLRTCIFPVATYSCESWTITQTIKKIINFIELECYRKILRIP
jgi:hypothetical protein